MENKYGLPKDRLERLLNQLINLVDVDNDRKVTLKEWNNWIDYRRSKCLDEQFLDDYPDHQAWKRFFYKLSKGTQEIKLKDLQKHIKPDDVKMKKEMVEIYIKSYIKGTYAFYKYTKGKVLATLQCTGKNCFERRDILRAFNKP